VNSPGLGFSWIGGEFVSEGKLRGAKAELNESGELLTFGSGFAGEILGAIAFQSGAEGMADWSATDFTFGGAWKGCWGSFDEALDAAGFACGSNSRSN
jgi:hypothetical protein